MRSVPDQELEGRLREVCAEIEQRIRNGEHGVALRLIEEYPDLSLDDESLIEIFYAEYLSSIECDHPLQVDRWMQTYPRLRDRIERLLCLHDVLNDDSNAGASRKSFESNSLLFPPSKGIRTLGQYILLEEIAHGSFGTVYKAKQLGLGRIVAIKLIHSADGASSEKKKLETEASSIAALQHPNIVQIFELGRDQGCDFISMEYIDGGTLQDQLQKPRTVHEIASLMLQLSDAIRAAHFREIVHSDLKPANILIDQAGNPKIVDFGLARQLGSEQDFSCFSGSFAGTPSHMAPEQIIGTSGKVGPRSDIYALGIILYQLITKRLPFVASTPEELMAMILRHPPKRPSSFDRLVPRDLETICVKCLAKNPADRYETAGHLHEDLSRFLDHRPIHARRGNVWERCMLFAKRKPWIVLASGVVLSFLIAIISLERRHREELERFNLDFETKRRSAEQDLLRAKEAEQAVETSLFRARAMVGRWSELGESLGDAPGMSNVGREALENAVEYYEEFLRRSGRNPDIRIQAAKASIRVSVLYSQLGLWRKAEAGLQNAEEFLEDLPMTPEIEWELSNCRAHQGMLFERLERWNESEQAHGLAIERFKSLVIRFPKSSRYGLRLASTWIRLSLVMQHEQKWDESISTLLQAIEQQIECFEQRSGKKSSIRPVWRESSRTERVSADSLIDKVGLLKAQIGPTESDIWRELCDENGIEELAMGLDGLGYALMNQGQNATSERAFREALSLREITEHHRPTDLWRNQFVARNERHLAKLLFECQRKEEALAILDRAISRMEKLSKDFPSRVDYRIDWSQTLGEAARIIRANNDPVRAIKIANVAIGIQEELVANNPGFSLIKKDLALSLSTLALSHHAFESDSEAIECYERTLKVDPTYAAAMNNYSWLLCTTKHPNLRDAKKAKQLIQKAIEIRPNRPRYWSTLALAAFRNNEFELADQAIVKSLEYGNTGDTINEWLLKSMIDARLGRLESAEKWLVDAEERRKKEQPGEAILIRFKDEASAILAECRSKARVDGL